MFHRKAHELRIQVVNPAGMSADDAAFVSLLQEHPPRTRFQHGDLAMLVGVPKHLGGRTHLPNMWEVRAVYSRYQFELQRLMNQTGGMFDWALNQLELNRRLPPNRWHEPVVYAHAFPHGEWPSSAEWFPEWCLRRLSLRAPTENWEPILDEFSTPYMGYDPADFGSGIVFDLAPDIYGDQRPKKRPLSFEEESFHRVALVAGLEEKCIVPAEVQDIGTDAVDIFDIWG